MRPSTADVNKLRNEKEDEAGVGSSLADFKVMCELGKGAYGVVYKVISVRDGREYVLKKIPIKHLKKNEIQDVVREAKILRKVENKNIIKSFSHFVEGGHLNIVMEYAEGGDLQKVVKPLIPST
jgi:NIMA (never in mitosis gene a)-related kinase